jgi:hypothetical protein
LSLQYALVTSSSLPDEIQASEYYTEVDKAQWLDLVDYCQQIVQTDPDQRISFLIVAKGTEEQEAADQARRDAEEAALASQSEEQRRLEEEKRLAREKAAKEADLQKALRAKSKSIFNALYRR